MGPMTLPDISHNSRVSDFPEIDQLPDHPVSGPGGKFALKSCQKERCTIALQLPTEPRVKASQHRKSPEKGSP